MKKINFQPSKTYYSIYLLILSENDNKKNHHFNMLSFSFQKYPWESTYISLTIKVHIVQLVYTVLFCFFFKRLFTGEIVTAASI